MNIFPELKEEILTQDNLEKYGTKDLLFDFKTERVILKDGKVIFADKIKQVQQWIELLIKSETGKYKVYDETDFGMTNLYGLRGHSLFENPFLLMELEREIKEKIENKNEIRAVTNISTEYNFNQLFIKITVQLITGEIAASEVNI
ncbi:MAG: DUF2634 domain-containing protein [Fusobacteriaceae bacterium]